MARRHSPRHPLFRQRWFADDIIITCVRWYLRFKLSYRDLAELARELGVSVAPSTIRIKRYLWHGNVFQALNELQSLEMDLDAAAFESKDENSTKLLERH